MPTRPLGARHGLGNRPVTDATCRWISAPPWPLSHAPGSQVARTGRDHTGSTARCGWWRGCQQLFPVSKGLGRRPQRSGPRPLNPSRSAWLLGGLHASPKSFRRERGRWVAGLVLARADRPVLLGDKHGERFPPRRCVFGGVTGRVLGKLLPGGLLRQTRPRLRYPSGRCWARLRERVDGASDP